MNGGNLIIKHIDTNEIEIFTINKSKCKCICEHSIVDKNKSLPEHIITLGEGSDGIVLTPPLSSINKYVDLLYVKTRLQKYYDLLSELQKIQFNEILDSYIKKSFDDDEPYLTNNYIGKIILEPTDEIENIILNSILIDIKLKLHVKDYEKIGNILHKITILDNTYGSFKNNYSSDYFINLIYNNCGNIINFTDTNITLSIIINFIEKVKNINNNNIIHMDIRYTNILLKDNDILLIDFGSSTIKKKIYFTIYDLLTRGIKIYPIEFSYIYLFIYLIKYHHINTINKLLDFFIKKNDIDISLYDSLINNKLSSGFIFLYKYYCMLNLLYIIDINIDNDDLNGMNDEKYDEHLEKIKNMQLSANKNDSSKYNESISYGKLLFDKYNNIFIELFVNCLNKEINKDKILNDDDIIIILDKILGENYYKKVDVFYLGVLMLYICSKRNDINFIDFDIIQKCIITSDLSKRYTIDELYDNIKIIKIGGGKNKIKKGGFISAIQPINTNEVSLKKIQQPVISNKKIQQPVISNKKIMLIKLFKLDDDIKIDDDIYSFNNNFTNKNDDNIINNTLINILENFNNI